MIRHIIQKTVSRFMQIIDFHTHIYPDPIAQKATHSIENFYHLEGGHMNGTVKNLLERGGLAGISRYVVLPVGLKPGAVRHINEFAVSQVAEHPEFIGFGTIHAAMENIEEEVEFVHESGLYGVKMHPDTQLFDIDDERLFPAYELLRDKGLHVMLHMGDPRYDYSHPARLRKVMDNFPGIKVVAAHFGGYSMYETAYELLKDTDCVMDISSSLMFMEKEEAVRHIRRIGTERLVFGSDFPLWDPVHEVQVFMGLGLTADETEQIAHRTAERILNL